jgi:alginate O-acetyltransferase complex protein AlgI
MTFTTLTFILFLALFFPLYWGLRNRTAQNALIVLASYFFYGWWDFRFCALMLIASLLDYGVGLGLNRAQNPGTRRLILTLGLAGNIGMLGFFKYFNFFAENFRVMAAGIGWQVDPVTLHIVLPVGISFYTFQTMCYSIDVYRGRLRATPRLIEYLAYVSFFPQLVAGPIERATNLLPQFFAKRSFQYDLAVNGCRQILWGCFKKMVIADNLGPLVDEAFADPSRFSGGELAMATLFFAFQIYCDFSASLQRSGADARGALAGHGGDPDRGRAGRRRRDARHARILAGPAPVV